MSAKLLSLLKCKCPSRMYHRADCELAHPEIASLPSELPDYLGASTLPSGKIRLCELKEEVADAGIHAAMTVRTASDARALARTLLVFATEMERSDG